MNEALNLMLKKYNCKSISDYENALKEVVQEIALLGLWRAKFYEKAAFYGGSALRILYGLNRFSEDLDFSLLKADEDTNLNKYHKAIESELTSFGLNVDVIPKTKTYRTQIDSAFIKAGTLQNMISIKVPVSLRKRIHKNKVIKIKFEVDKDPPDGFDTEAKYLLQPIPFSINTFTMPSLFAGKMHAVLCRKWQKRVKGRDWYDLVWFIGRNTLLNLTHLELRMKQSEHLKQQDVLTKMELLKLLNNKIDNVDFLLAKNDVRNFIKDQDTLKVWSKDFFRDIVKGIKFENRI
ncbi:MAG: nucleotidyl transferase AbiEii/AbiGii toxin family protein [Candidatus Cloacimonetes bacterium]|jgi:predicted nucleotidyltransferase component of viral defense system|nr:nucleotidyl transferase AbiEii/AbiGii toxin family protein [Candidatus Cloacimonadota bacterium]